MKKNSVILDILTRHQTPVNLNELLAATQNTIPSRTLRRLLKQLADEGKVRFLGAKRNRRYSLNNLNEASTYDLYRIQYRQQRRELITRIIKEKIKVSDFQSYIEKAAMESIPTVHQQKFIQHALDDLHYLDVVKLAGLGVIREEFVQWKEVINK